MRIIVTKRERWFSVREEGGGQTIEYANILLLKYMYANNDYTFYKIYSRSASKSFR